MFFFFQIFRYNTSHREGRVVDENSFQPLQATPTLTYGYNKVGENNDKSIPRVLYYIFNILNI